MTHQLQNSMCDSTLNNVKVKKANTPSKTTKFSKFRRYATLTENKNSPTLTFT